MFILYRLLPPKTNIISLSKIDTWLGRLLSFWSWICRGFHVTQTVPEARLVTEVATVYSSLHPWVWLTMPIHWHRASKKKAQMWWWCTVALLEVSKLKKSWIHQNMKHTNQYAFNMYMITNQWVKVKVVRWCLFPSPKTKERRCGSLPISQR